MITVNKQKMSKSLKNFFTMSELLKHYDGEVIRLYLISISYHKPLNFDVESLEQARKNYEYLSDSYAKLKNIVNNKRSGADVESGKIEIWRKDFENAMDLDFNTSLAFATLFEIFKFINANSATLSSKSAEKIDKLLKNVFNVLGFVHIGEKRESVNLSFKDDLVKLVEQLSQKNSELKEVFSQISLEGDAATILKEIIDLRWNFRKQKRFDISDLIRDELRKIGVMLEDSKEGTTYRLVKTDEGK